MILKIIFANFVKVRLCLQNLIDDNAFLHSMQKLILVLVMCCFFYMTGKDPKLKIVYKKTYEKSDREKKDKSHKHKHKDKDKHKHSDRHNRDRSEKHEKHNKHEKPKSYGGEFEQFLKNMNKVRYQS